MNKKVITGDYTDPDTGIRFIEDDRGNYHVIQQFPDQNKNISVVVQNTEPNETLEKENKRYKRILEKLRMENNWLWEIIYLTIKEKKTPQKAVNDLEKKIKERIA